MFEERKKYDADKFVLICKEMVMDTEPFLINPKRRPTISNIGVKHTLDGICQYSLAYKHYGNYIDLLTLQKLADLNFSSEVGEIVVTKVEKLFKNDLREKISCIETYNKYMETYGSNTDELDNKKKKKILKIASKIINGNFNY